MKKIIQLFVGLSALLFSINAQSQWITVGDPQEEWWYYNQATIEEAEFVVKPQGLYLGVDMYLTFSGRDMGYPAEDTIELVCNFDLPHGSFINDSWLWLNQDTLVADLMDRWTASTIYNEIVGRQQDPSILYKTWGNEYELRIYPMQGDSSRRVKLSYLTPLSFNYNSVSASLPIDLLQASYHEVKNVKIRLLSDSNWEQPKIKEYPEIEFASVESELYGTNKELVFDAYDYSNHFTLQYNTPMKDGIFFNYLDNEEDYYQIAVLPSVFIDSIISKKVLICVDFVNNHYFEKEEVYNVIKNAVPDGLSEHDLINIMFSSTDIKPVFADWVLVTDIADSIAKLEETGSLSESIIKSYSYIPGLLTAGLNYLIDNSGDALYLIANSEKDGDPSAVNDLIADLNNIIDNRSISIHIADFMTDYTEYYWAGNNYYYGNEYLYINLAKLTDGNHKRIEPWKESLYEFVMNFTMGIDGAIETLDIYTSAENGFCYSRMDLSNNSALVYLNQPVLQVGKFYGEFPFSIEVNGLYNNTPFAKRIIINQDDVYENDSLLEEIWAGNYIAELEKNLDYYSNDAIREIIDYSIQERVLSEFTAFLAIEPGALDDLSDSETGDEGGGDWPVSSIEEEVQDGLEITAYPNPFVESISFKIPASQNLADENVTIKIYNIAGKLIFQDQIYNRNTDNLIEYEWLGDDASGNQIDKGTYIVVFESLSFKEVVKVVKF